MDKDLDIRIRDSLIEELKQDLAFEKKDRKYAMGTAFIGGILVGVIAAAAIMFGF